MNIKVLLIINMSVMILMSLSGCGPSRPKDINEDYFFTEIFPHEKEFGIYPEVHIIYPVNEKIIFLLGNDEYVVSNEKKQNAYFFSSVDGGKKFKKQTLGNGYLENIHATDDGRNISLIKRVYYDSYNFKYQLLHSVDAGEHWTTFDFFDNKKLECAAFITADTGIVYVSEDPVGYDTQNLYKTTDGGISWKKVFVENSDKYYNCRYCLGQSLLALDKENNKILDLDIETMNYKFLDINIPKHLDIYSEM